MIKLSLPNPNQDPLLISDLKTEFGDQVIDTPVYVPPDSPLFIALSPSSLLSFSQGDIAQAVGNGDLLAEKVTHQRCRNLTDLATTALAPINPNFSRTSGLVSCVIPMASASGYIPGEAVSLASQNIFAIISSVQKHRTLLGPDPLYFVVQFMTDGADVAPTQIVGSLEILNGKVTIEISGTGHAGGLGPNSMLYVGGDANVIQGLDPSYINLSHVTSGTAPKNSIFAETNRVFYKDEAEVVVDMTGVSSWNGRKGDILPEPDDFPTSLIKNASPIPGTTLNDALAKIYAPGVVLVRTIADLPAPVGGVRTLAPKSIYYILDTINLGTDRLATSGVVSLRGVYPSTSRIITASASPLFACTHAVILDSVSLVNPMGPCLSMTGAIPADPNVALRSSDVVFSGNSAQGVVQIQNCDGIATHRTNWGGCTGVCIKVGGTIRGLLLNQVGVASNTAGTTFLQVPAGAVINGRIASNLCRFEMNGGYAFDVDPSTIGPEMMLILNCAFNTTGLLTGVTAQSDAAFFSANQNLENTYPKAAYRMTQNAVSSAFTVDTWQKLSGTTAPIASRLFNLDTSNRAVYVGGRKRQVAVTAFVTLETSQINHVLEISVAVSGVPNTLFVARGTTTGPFGDRIENLPLLAIVTLAPNDYVEVWARDVTANADLTWTDGQLTIIEFGT